jgi:hypothetical protein
MSLTIKGHRVTEISQYYGTPSATRAQEFYFPKGEVDVPMGCAGLPSAIKIVGVTVNANNTAATHSNRLFFTL